MFQLQPVKFSREFATAATVYLALNMLVRGRGGGGWAPAATGQQPVLSWTLLVQPHLRAGSSYS
jgi:hypothetical protein